MPTIQEVLAVPKRVTSIHSKQKSQRQHVERELDLEARVDGRLTVFVRANVILPESFSIGLLYQAEGAAPKVLLRVNGNHGGHRNPDGTQVGEVAHVHRPSDDQLGTPADDASEVSHADPLEAGLATLPQAWMVFRERAAVEANADVDQLMWELHATLAQLDLDLGS